MFYYFGRKGRLASLYPAPHYNYVIEPFAGSMAYTLHNQPVAANGIEREWLMVEAWRRITALSPTQILSLPEPAIGERVTDRWMMMAAGSHGTTKAQSYLWTERMARDLKKQKRLAARHVVYAQRISYTHGDYHDAPDACATWFIDPPYQHVARGYSHDINYSELAEWCQSRHGQVIVCEQLGADWLPFKPLTEIRGTTNKQTTEVVWIGGRG